MGANVLGRETDSTSSNAKAFERRSRYSEDHPCDLVQAGVSLGLGNGLDVLGQSVEVVQTSHPSGLRFSNRWRREVAGMPPPFDLATVWQ